MITIESATCSLQYRKCNRINCSKCGDGRPKHGPYYYLYKHYQGQGFSIYIGRAKPADMQPHYEKLAAKIERITTAQKALCNLAQNACGEG
jgi:hypothetical protein